MDEFERQMMQYVARDFERVFGSAVAPTLESGTRVEMEQVNVEGRIVRVTATDGINTRDGVG